MSNLIRYDFNTILTKLTDKLKVESAWVDTYNSSTGQILLRLIAAGVENLGYYLERRVQELYMEVARIPSSVRHLASLLGYIPNRKTAATGTATVTFAVGQVTDTTLSKGLIFYADEKPFTLMDNIVIPALSTSPQTMTVYQGLYQNIQYPLKSLGDLSDFVEFYNNGKVKTIIIADDEDIVVDYNDISNNVFNIYAVGDANESIEYVLGDRTIDSLSPTDKFYLLRNQYGNIKLYFGNGISGANPYDENETPIVIVEYLKTLGEDGNISTTQSDLSFTTSLGITGSYTLSLADATSGTAEEDVESIKVNAPRKYSTGNRAVTREDYKTYLEQYTSVVKAVAWGEHEERNLDGIDAINARNRVRYTILGEDYIDLNLNTDVLDENINTGDGTTLVFTKVLVQSIIAGSIDIEYTIGASTYHGIDLNHHGIITGTNLSGTINYKTKTIILTFTTAPDDTTVILADYKKASFTTAVDTYLEDYKTATVETEYIDIINTYDYLHTMNLTIILYISDGYVFNVVAGNVESAITAEYDDDYFEFGGKLFKSDLTKTIVAVEGVDGCSLIWNLVGESEPYNEDVWNAYDDSLNYDRPFANIIKIGTITTQVPS